MLEHEGDKARRHFSVLLCTVEGRYNASSDLCLGCDEVMRGGERLM